jgi:hypothetical protein
MKLAAQKPVKRAFSLFVPQKISIAKNYPAFLLHKT